MKKENKAFEFKPFSIKQQKILNWWRSGSPYSEYDMMIADGSIRSGKTIACICSFLLWSQQSFSGESFIVAGKTIGSLKRNVIKPMQQILSAWNWQYNYNRSENYLEIGSNTYFMYDASNEASQDKLQGLTAAGAYADEVALFPRSFIDQMIGRCSVDGAKIFLNCNPEGPHHYVKEEFIDKAKEKKVFHLHFTMDDNLSLSEKVKERFKRMFTGVFYKRFILGLWVAAEGLGYQEFADNVQDYIIDDNWFETHRIMYGTIGVDFGGTKSAHAFCFTGFTEGFHDVVTIKEYYKKKRISPATLEDDFCDFVRQIQSKYKCYEAYMDSAEQSIIAGMESAVLKAHIPIEIKNARKYPINDRIAFYNSMMSQGRYKIHSSCKHTIEALESAVYDEKQMTKDIRLDDGLMNIDSLDSMEYSTENIMNDIIYL